MALQTTINVRGVPLQGGAVTVRDRGLLKPGQFSMIQNVRPQHPGYEKRAGQRLAHTTADGTNSAISMYQFKKTRVTGNQYFVLMSDGDILELTTAPPGVTTGAMGSEAWSGTTAPKPPSWSNLNDMLVFSNCVDQHQLYPGATSYVDKFIVYKTGASTLPGLVNVLEDGLDFSAEVSDAQTSTAATLTGIDHTGAGTCGGVFIRTSVPAKSFTFTLGTVNDGSATTLSLYFWENDSTWHAASITGTEGTSSGGVSMKQSGTVSFTTASTPQERYLFGQVGYWYLLTWSEVLGTCTVTGVTYDAAWSSLESFWDGLPTYAVVVLVEGSSYYDTYSGDSVDLAALAAGKKIYIGSADPLEGLYIDPGITPNINTTMAIDTFKYWDGSAFVAYTASTVIDGTSGIVNAGWITFPRTALQHPRQMESNKIYGYWYELVYKTAAVSASVVVTIQTMPYFDIEDWGYTGQCSCVWKERILYSWADKYQEYVYITAPNSPQVLTGEEAAILEVGDGRPHKIVAMKNFFNNVLVYQEEKGVIGGCITMLQGYDPPTFGKLVLSTKIGTMNAKSVDVVENVYTATATEEELKTVAFSLSRYGVCACDGTSIGIISDDIQNYFDPLDTTYCITRGAEDQMWLKHDPIDHVLRIGLACGGSATCNVFPVYDLIARCWYFDVRQQKLGFWENVEAASGNVSIVQYGGGIGDGFLYQTNYGTADVSTAIDTFLTVEFPGYGQYLDLTQFMFTCKAQTGNITFTTLQNNITKDTLTLSMASEYSNQEIRRHLLSLNVMDQHLSVKIQNSSATESMTIMAAGLEVKLWVNR